MAIEKRKRKVEDGRIWFFLKKIVLKLKVLSFFYLKSPLLEKLIT